MRKVVAGNWKMHMGPSDTRAFLASFTPDFADDAAPRILLFPPATSIEAAASALAGRGGIELGVQNIHAEDSGAFTGETSAGMAKDAGAGFALVGHSERRHVFGDSDDDVLAKTEAALRHGLTPVVCVGETLDQRRAGQVAAVIERQLSAVLGVLSQGAEFMVAYEPVWAIGTGETASPSDAAEAHSTLRTLLVERLGAEAARCVPILYGGSVKPSNAAELMSAPEIDGVLVGGASLDPASFEGIAEAGAAVGYD